MTQVRTGLAAFLLLASACGGPRNSKMLGEDTEAVTVCAAGAVTAGIDVSEYQGTINWTAVASDTKNNIKFAYAKATEGGGTLGAEYQDPQFAANWPHMKAAGIIRGAYHFFHSADNGTTQADNYLAVVNAAGGFAPGDLPPMLDWESTDSGSSSAQAVANAQAFITEIKAKTGMATVVYTDFGFFTGLTGTGGFSSDPLWVAAWTCTSNCTGLPSGCPGVDSPWSNWIFWQWSDSGAIAGISSNPDSDVFNGTLAQLQSFAGGTVTPSFAPPAQVTGNDAITLVNWTDKHMELFAKSPAGEAMHTWTTGTNDAWETPEQLDTGADCGSAAAFWGPSWSYPELFSPLTSGASGHLSWSAANGWTTYADFAGSTTGLTHFSTTVGNDGRVWVFGLGSDKAIWEQSWSMTSSAWSGWTSLGGTFATGAGAITWGNGTLEIFATDASGEVWHKWLTTSATAWSAWTQISGGIASRPVPVRWSDGSAGHAELFARGTDNHLYVSDYDYSLTAGYPAFSVVSSSTAIEGDPSAIMNPSGNPQVFARSATGEVVQTLWNGSAFPTMTAIGTQVVASDPFAWTRGDGNAEVFAVDSSGNLTRSYDKPSTGWTAWAPIGSGFDSCVGGVAATDAGVAEDAGSVLRDAGIEVDAGRAEHDAGVVEHDAGVTVHDAGVTTHDAGAAEPDAGSSSHDAGVVESDAGTSRQDAGETVHDAGAATQDAGLSESDAGVEQAADAGAVENADGGSAPVALGCHCSSATSPDAMLWLFLAIGQLGWRRRARASSLPRLPREL